MYISKSLDRTLMYGAPQVERNTQNAHMWIETCPQGFKHTTPNFDIMLISEIFKTRVVSKRQNTVYKRVFTLKSKLYL